MDIILGDLALILYRLNSILVVEFALDFIKCHLLQKRKPVNALCACVICLQYIFSCLISLFHDEHLMRYKFLVREFWRGHFARHFFPSCRDIFPWDIRLVLHKKDNIQTINTTAACAPSGSCFLPQRVVEGNWSDIDHVTRSRDTHTIYNRSREKQSFPFLPLHCMQPASNHPAAIKTKRSCLGNAHAGLQRPKTLGFRFKHRSLRWLATRGWLPFWRSLDRS